ncbi:DUF6406 domain-containing protein [Solwaraspora sp. WMMB335]|uniref:DUF6406 domain-containing protein n=1 Tax=Solwaraspora sp. WMMB335 TaxID=3404118 RepID=UPI003B93430A
MPMPSFVDVAAIANNVPVPVGPARLGVRWIDASRPVSAEIMVLPVGPGEAGRYVLNVGNTFPVGEETWYFAGAHFDSADRWRVTVRRLAPGAVPPVVDEATAVTGWAPAQQRPYGRLDEEQVRSLESALGRVLPPEYRRWLAETNGVQPVGMQHLPGVPFALLPERPLLGVHPQYRPFDLVAADRQWRVGKLSEAYVVVAVPADGLVVVRAEPPQRDAVFFLPEAAVAGTGTPETIAWREQRLEPVARSIGDFLSRLTPLAAPDGDQLPPATIVE